jgi:hypothetical protein
VGNQKMIDYKVFQFDAHPFTHPECFARAMDELVPVWNITKPQQVGVTLICHPLTYIERWYEHEKPVISFEHLIKFIILQYLTGALGDGAISSAMFKTGFDASICLRIEDMPTAFVEFCNSLGICESRRSSEFAVKCLSNGWFGRSASRLNQEWKPEWKSFIASREREFMEYYDYWI